MEKMDRKIRTNSDLCLRGKLKERCSVPGFEQNHISFESQGKYMTTVFSGQLTILTVQQTHCSQELHWVSIYLGHVVEFHLSCDSVYVSV